ncbi:MAG: bifunctional hydroxymethylpyrimidine kinase/phosphomethylpyrimidine kinase [Alphaproteobacteria bacterium]|nr:bifunctional hydroxymethylpyrimidine kinase/phosphomethylpyrimidine kinase [Alphaproteobacteria bacterium]
MVAQILCIGQSDSSGVTGIQADIKTAQAFGGYAATVLTAVSARNTQNYNDVMMLPPDLIRDQFKTVMEDLSPSVIKIGFLGSVSVIELVSSLVEPAVARGVKIVVDPVMKSRGGKIILGKEEQDALKRSLIVQADVLVPNVSEAEALTGMTVRDIDDMRHVSRMLLTLGPKAVVLRGGDFSSGSESIVDILAEDEKASPCQSDRIADKEKCDGEGATMTTALAVCLAQGHSLSDSYARARAYVNRAVLTSEAVGHGYIPLNHRVCADDGMAASAVA